jgi:hypothetical protein
MREIHLVRSRCDKLARFQHVVNDSDSRSAAILSEHMPRTFHTTPSRITFTCSPKKFYKIYLRFLGLNNQKQQQPLPETPNHNGSGLVKSSLSSSTPMVLESCDNDDIYHSVSETRWQSNDGLLTPGSMGALSPFGGSPGVSVIYLIYFVIDEIS